MATTEILTFADDPAANVLTQAEYEALPAQLTGFGSGILPSKNLNKVLRQSSFIAAGIANWLVSQGISVPDDGDLSTLVDNFQAAIEAVINTTGWSTGDVKVTLKTTADTGWVMFDDGTIGDASSGGTTRANADTEALFTLLWNNTTNGNCAVSGGRGANAAADYAAHKTIALPKALGRALAVAGAGSGLTSRALAVAVGEETHTLDTSEMPAHTHREKTQTFLNGNTAGTDRTFHPAASFTDNSVIESTGGGSAHNNMQPTTFLNIMVKL